MTDAEITPPTKKAPAKRGQKRKQVEDQQEDGQQVGLIWVPLMDSLWTDSNKRTMNLDFSQDERGHEK